LILVAVIVAGGMVRAQTLPNAQLNAQLSPASSPTPAVVAPSIKLGATGPQVATYQQELTKLKFYNGPISGVYDAATEQSVKAFQAFHYLASDGILGPITGTLITQLATHTHGAVVTPTAPVVQNNLVPASATSCVPGGQPSITILSPNGGEIYQAGQQVTVTWKSCNVPQNSSVGISFTKENSTEWGVTPQTTVGSWTSNLTANDGQEVVTIPNSPIYNYPNFQYGGGFKMHVVLYSSNVPPLTMAAQDYSDGYFTINNASSQASSGITINASSAQQVTSASGSTAYLDYSLNFAVANNSGSDYFIPVTSGWSSFPGFEFGVFNSSNTEVSMQTGSSMMSSLNSLAPVVDNGAYYKVSNGTEQYFNLSVLYQTSVSGQYRIKLKDVRGFQGVYPSQQGQAGILITPTSNMYSDFAEFVH